MHAAARVTTAARCKDPAEAFKASVDAERGCRRTTARSHANPIEKRSVEKVNEENLERDKEHGEFVVIW